MEQSQAPAIFPVLPVGTMEPNCRTPCHGNGINTFSALPEVEHHKYILPFSIRSCCANHFTVYYSPFASLAVPRDW